LPEVQIGAFFDHRLCNARRFAPIRYLLVCEYHVSDWQIRNRSGSITLAPCRAAIGGFMGSYQRGSGDPLDPWFETRDRRGAGASSVLLATLLGIGIGLLAAPQPGTKTRKLLRKRLAALGEGVGEGLEEMQEVGSKARKRAKQRLAKLREDAGEEWEDVGERWTKAKDRIRDMDLSGEEDDSSVIGTILAIAAGAAATYFLTSDRAAPVRSRVQGAASDVRRRATDQWDRFQRGGFRQREQGSAQESRPESRSGTPPGGDTPQAS
jgi:gas vesicle protein